MKNELCGSPESNRQSAMSRIWRGRSLARPTDKGKEMYMCRGLKNRRCITLSEDALVVCRRTDTWQEGGMHLRVKFARPANWCAMRGLNPRHPD